MNRDSTSPAPGGNPLGEKPVGRLLLQFAIPSIVSTLVGALIASSLPQLSSASL